jgi:CDP-glucose 4,6-dehydratase
VEERPCAVEDVVSAMFDNVFANKRVLITGHTGFKGTWLTSWLLKLGAHVTGYSDRIPTEPSMFDILGLADRIDHHLGDVRDLATFSDVVRETRPDFVFHLAAQAIVSTSYKEPLDTISVNVMGTATVMEALRQVDHPCVAVIITSDKCYENVEWEWGYRETDRLGGKDIYSGSKGAAEVIFHSYVVSFFRKPDCPVRLASARAGNVIGGGDWAADRIVVDCMRSWAAGKPVELRSPSATRPWQHVLEPLSGYLQLAAAMAAGKVAQGDSFNFGPPSEQNRTVLELMRDLSAYWHFTDPTSAYTVTGNIPFHEAGLLKLNCDKALLHLKWHASLNYEQVVRLVSEWYYGYYRGNAEMYGLTMDQIGQYEAHAQTRGLPWTRT